jgi:hypothetical protein
MTTETNVAVTTEAPRELKSTDTAYRAVLEVPKAEPKEKTKPEPVKQEVVEPEVPPEGEIDDAPGAASPQKGTEKRLPRWMKERLERERQVTEARTREAMLREFQERQPKAEPVHVADQPKEKTIEDFDFDQQRYTDYLVDRKLEKRDEQQRVQAEQKKQAEAAETFKSRIDAFEERAGDGTWEDIVASPVNTDPSFKSLTDLFMGDEHDLDIAHYLASNLKEAERIKGLPRLQQVREIAKLAETFEGGSQDEVSTPSKPAPLPKKTTTAPPPPKTVSGSGKPSVDVNDPNLSTAQRIAAWRNKGKR